MSAALAATRVTPRPAAIVPPGWHCVTSRSGLESWTWSEDGLPIASALVSPQGEIGPTWTRDPLRYWADASRIGRAGEALQRLARFVSLRTAPGSAQPDSAELDAPARVVVAGARVGATLRRDPLLRLRAGERRTWRFLR